MAIDLTLPETSSPTIDPYRHESQSSDKFALFIHIPLENDEEIRAIEKKCVESLTDGNEDDVLANIVQHVSPPSPHPGFVGEPLRAAMEYFLNTVIPTREWDFFLFVAVVDEDWREKGVILVTMDDGLEDDAPFKVDQLRLPVEEAGMALTNLQLANQDWDELKEEYEGEGDEDKDEDEDEDGDGWEDDDSDDDENDQPWKTGQTDDEYSDGSAKVLPESTDYWIGLYSVPGIRFVKVMRDLDPSWGPRKPLSELMCRPQGCVPASPKSEAVAEAVRLHPMRCRNNPLLNRNMFFVVDTTTPEEDGILVVKMDWNSQEAENAALSMSDLASLGQKALIDTKRLPYEMGTTLTLFNEVVAGYRPWKHTHHTFLAYAGPTIDQPSAYLKAIDPSFSRRKSGSERFVEVPSLLHYDEDADMTTGIEEHDVELGFRTAVKEHWRTIVHQERFRETLCADYFIFCNEELKASEKDKMVYLVKPEKDSGEWSAMKVPAWEVYQTLCDVVDGKRDWKGGKEGPKNS